MCDQLKSVLRGSMLECCPFAFCRTALQSLPRWLAGWENINMLLTLYSDKGIFQAFMSCFTVSIESIWSALTDISEIVSTSYLLGQLWSADFLLLLLLFAKCNIACRALHNFQINILWIKACLDCKTFSIAFSIHDTCFTLSDELNQINCSKELKFH